MRRAGRIATVLAAAAIAACFTKPGAPHATGDPDARLDGRGTNIDAAIDSMVDLGSCPEDDFENPAVMKCETWGSASGSATFSRGSNVLEVQFGGMNDSGTCTTKVPFDISHGTSIEIAQMPSAGPVNLTLMTAGTTTKLEVQRPFGMYAVHLICNTIDLGTGTTAESSPPGWLQLRVANATADGFDVLAETSSDGSIWNPTASCHYPSAPSSTGTVSFTANSGSGSGTAQIDNFNTKNCP